jgi:hypothetical protein
MDWNGRSRETNLEKRTGENFGNGNKRKKEQRLQRRRKPNKRKGEISCTIKKKRKSEENYIRMIERFFVVVVDA